MPSFARRVVTLAVCYLATSLFATCGQPQVPLEQLLASVSAVQLAPARPKPPITLLDQSSREYDFVRETDRRLTFLFFGFTHCADVCPAQLARLGSVLRLLDEEKGSRVRVVFVSVDPDRDTPERVRAWLAGFHPEFVGLTGPLESVHAAMTALGLRASSRGLPAQDERDYQLRHPSGVLVFTPDGLLRMEYIGNVVVSRLAEDIAKLLDYDWSAVRAADS